MPFSIFIMSEGCDEHDSRLRQLQSALQLLKAKVSQDDSAQEVSLDWEDRLSEILFEFESSLDDSTQNKTADQLMALGSFRTYLMLSLRALKSSGL